MVGIRARIHAAAYAALTLLVLETEFQETKDGSGQCLALAQPLGLGLAMERGPPIQAHTVDCELPNSVYMVPCAELQYVWPSGCDRLQRDARWVVTTCEVESGVTCGLSTLVGRDLQQGEWYDESHRQPLSCLVNCTSPYQID